MLGVGTVEVLESYGLCLTFGQFVDKLQCQLQTLFGIIGLFFGKCHSAFVYLYGGVLASQKVDAMAFDQRDAPGFEVDDTAQLLSLIPQGDEAVLHHISCIFLVVQQAFGHTLHCGLQRQYVAFELFGILFHTE